MLCHFRLLQHAFNSFYSRLFRRQIPIVERPVVIGAGIIAYKSVNGLVAFLETVRDGSLVAVPAIYFHGKELDPRLPVNLTEKLAKIPVLLIYGADDLVVPPADNCELFAERFRKHGGSIQIVKRPSWGHHPHGLDDPAQIVEFMTEEK